MPHPRPEFVVVAAAACLVFCVGCSKKPDEGAPSPTPTASAEPAAPAPSVASAPTAPTVPPWGAAAAAKSITGKLTIEPNPVAVCEKTGVGTATVSWTATNVGIIEVRVNSPDGALLTRSGSIGKAKTGPWVSKGTVFLLQDGSEGVPRTLDHTLARLEVTETVKGPCK